MLKNKLILGIGITGMSCANFFKSKDIPFKIFDTRDKKFFVDYDFGDISLNSIYFKEYTVKGHEFESFTNKWKQKIIQFNRNLNS